VDATLDEINARIGWLVAELVFGIYEHYEKHAHEIETAWR
jgi:hypothetical protein